MNDKKAEKFVRDYENKVKKLRDRYYEKLHSNEYKDPHGKINYNSVSIIITFAIAAIILINAPGAIVDIIVLAFVTLSTIITRYIIKEDDNLQNNDFVRTIYWMGYKSIEEYDEKLSEYVTGTGGVYQRELEEYKKIYSLDDNTTYLYAQNNDRYYAWLSNDSKTLNLLNTKITEKPKIESYTMDRIRYYRFNRTEKIIILKTDAHDYYFQEKSLEDIEELLPKKEFHETELLDVETYISDFEKYIDGEIKELENREKSCSKRKVNALYAAIFTMIIMALCIILESTIPSLKWIFRIIPIVVLVPYIINLSHYCREYFRIPKNKYEITKTLNESRKNINHFNELKVSLGIDNTSDVIYTKDARPYLTWVKDGYFHLFQNVITDNIIYISVKVADITHYKEEDTACSIKFKDKILIYKPCAIDIFRKIIPGKEYKPTKNSKK